MKQKFGNSITLHRRGMCARGGNAQCSDTPKMKTGGRFDLNVQRVQCDGVNVKNLSHSVRGCRGKDDEIGEQQQQQQQQQQQHLPCPE